MKYALALIVALLVWWHVLRKLLAFGRKLAQQAGQGASGGMRRAGDAYPYPHPSRHQHPHQPQAAQAMLPCQLCGVHVPHSEAVHRAGQVYCCAEHARQAAAASGG